MRLQKYFGSAVVGISLLLGGASVTVAATADNLFDVSVTLVSQCRAKDSGTKTLNFGTYTAFQAGAQTPAAPVSIEFECTRSFAPTSAALVGGNVGVVAGLQYTLTVGAASTTGGTAASTLTIGSGDTVSYSVNGSMPADQAGTDGAAGTVTRTLQLTF